MQPFLDYQLKCSFRIEILKKDTGHDSWIDLSFN